MLPPSVVQSTAHSSYDSLVTCYKRQMNKFSKMKVRWWTYSHYHFFGPCFVDLGAFQCYPSTWCAYNRDWMKSSQCQSLFGCTYLFFLFHVVGRSAKVTYQNKDWGKIVILMLKNIFGWPQRFQAMLRMFSNSYSTVLSHKCTTLRCQMYWAFTFIFIDWWKCRF